LKPGSAGKATRNAPDKTIAVARGHRTFWSERRVLTGALGPLNGKTSRDPHSILFLCTGNSCRSQMAEDWAGHLKVDVLEPYSAGTETHGLNPIAVHVMQEAGVDISRHRSKHVSEREGIEFDYVVTVCGHANENCPVFAGKAEIIPMGFDDPPKLAETAETEEERREACRRMRDETRSYIGQLPDVPYDERGED
jgi:arsenate reductase